jgi:phosphate-selective porin OprO/OprP
VTTTGSSGRVSRLALRWASICLAGLVTAILLAIAAPRASSAQEDEPEASATIDTTLEAGDADAEVPRRRFVKWNEYDGPITTFSFGAGLIWDFVGYSQDAESREQVGDLAGENGLRDFRFLARGKFKTKRPISWSLGYMYDGGEESWHWRQTGINIGIPEIAGQVFVGRTKEGFSAVKVMTGYYIWTPERSQALDAFIPILGDGIKYTGYLPGPRLLLNLGWYTDALGEGDSEKFAIYDHQFVTRLAWQPILSEEKGKVLHLAVMGRDAKADDGKIRMKSKPGVFLAPNFLDSGTFPADDAHTAGFEAFYRSGPWMLAAELDWQDVHALDGSTPIYRGGDVALIWNITGETRPYNARGGFFMAPSPKKTVFEGGIGGIEATLHFSFNDFDSGAHDGGKFWRASPVVLWHLTDALHMHFAYGYSRTERLGLEGTTEFFQTRAAFYF